MVFHKFKSQYIFQSRKENEWKVRRLGGKTRQAKLQAADKVGENYYNIIAQEKKQKRLETAGWNSSNWKIGVDGKENQPEKKRR